MEQIFKKIFAQFIMSLGILGFAFCLEQFQPLIASAQSGTGTIRVATTGADAAGCGSTALPCRTLQYAANLASSGDTIEIAQGTYTSSGSAVLSLTTGKSLTFIGGYTTFNWTIPSTNAALTMLDGGNARHGVEIISASAIAATFQNLTIQNGYDSSPIVFSDTQYSGGGVICYSTSSAIHSLSMSNVIVKNNKVQGIGIPPTSGGGVSLYARCNGSFQDVTFDGNQALAGNATDGTRGGAAMGGGFFATNQSNATATRVTFTNNLAQAGSGGSGSGASNGTNYPDGLGGGAAMQWGTFTLSNITASGNRAIAGSGTSHGGYGDGGALFFEYATAQISDSNLHDNLAQGGASTAGGTGGDGDGGAIMATDSSVTLNRTYMIHNASQGGNSSGYSGRAGGGAMYFTKAASGNVSNVTGTNLVMANNSSLAGSGANPWGGGGAVFSQDTVLTLNHATIVGNTIGSQMQGSAIVVLHNFSASTLNLNYSIVASNRSNSNVTSAIISQYGGDSAYLNYTLFYDLEATWSSTEMNPKLSCQYNTACVKSNTNEVTSGDPAFVSPGSPNYDYHIQSTSAAKDRAVGSTTSLDIDSQSRPYNGTSDIGADEYYPSFLLTVWTGNTVLTANWTVSSSSIAGLINHFEVTVTCEAGASAPAQMTCGVPLNVGMVTSRQLTGLTNLKHYTITVVARDASGTALLTSPAVTGMPAPPQNLFLPLTTK